ncbi:MAG: helix-turn-helix domain-containing protein [Clostridia bacterium]|nr:helix-turn-helix domain-containing protein [Clostridia bacterium]
MDSFGARLANARKAKGYTQEQLAELLAVSRTSIFRWESDKAMPDYGTIQQISRVLEYPFADQEFASQPVPVSPAESAMPAVPVLQAEPAPQTEADGQPAPMPTLSPAPKKHTKAWVIALSGLCLAVLCVLGVVFLLPKPSAEISVAPLSPVSYLISNDVFESGCGWDATFVFQNTSNVAFTPEMVVSMFYEGDRMDNKIVQTYDEIRPWMDGDQLTKDSTPLHLLYGTDQMYMTRIDVAIFGTDANGHYLRFGGTVELSQEWENQTAALE